MQTVLIVFHLMVVIALVGSVLLQRSEGGALGVGGGGGFMTGRGQANALTRATAILAGLFFVTSLALSIIASYSRAPKSILDTPAAQHSAPANPAAPAANPLEQLQQLEQQRNAPAATTPAAPVSSGGTPGGTAPAPALAPAAPALAPAAPAVPAAPEPPKSQ